MPKYIFRFWRIFNGNFLIINFQKIRISLILSQEILSIMLILKGHECFSYKMC